jgi:hypothetical protein
MTHNPMLIESAERILDLKNYVMCLYKKLTFLRVEYSLKSEKEKNDIAIEEFETCMNIRRCEKKLKYMQRLFESQMLNPYLVDINAVIEKYEDLLNQAKKLQERDFEMKHLLYEVNWNNLDKSMFEKVKFYKNLVNQINGTEQD